MSASPLIAVIMGSTSDWDTMRHVHDLLDAFDVPHECNVVGVTCGEFFDP